MLRLFWGSLSFFHMIPWEYGVGWGTISTAWFGISRNSPLPCSSCSVSNSRCSESFWCMLVRFFIGLWSNIETWCTGKFRGVGAEGGFACLELHQIARLWRSDDLDEFYCLEMIKTCSYVWVKNGAFVYNKYQNYRICLASIGNYS